MCKDMYNRSDEKLLEIRKVLKAQSNKVNKSKSEAKKLITELVILTAKGNFKKGVYSSIGMYSIKPGLIIGFHGCDKKVRDAIIKWNAESRDEGKRNGSPPFMALYIQKEYLTPSN